MSMALKTPSAGVVAHALGDVYRRLADVCEALTARVAEPGDGVRDMGVPEPGFTAEELMSDRGALDALVDVEVARIRDRYGVTARRHVAASRALHDYAWTVGLLTAGAWFLERRVPRIRPQDLWLDLASGAYVITPGRELACLTDDPLAGLPEVLTLPQEGDLRTALRRAVADHMRPLLAAIGPVARRGARPLWGMVGDDLVSGIWYLGRMLDREQEAVRAATDILPAAVPPYPSGAGFRRLTDEDGRTYTTRTRTGCCMFYAIRPAEACVTCPRTGDAERLHRLRD